MSLFSRAVREVRSSTEDWRPGWLRYQGDAYTMGTSSGVSVTESSAMTLSAVYAAVSFISETIATLPCDVYQKYGDGSRYPRTAPLWMTEPVPGQMGWTEFVQQVMTSLLLDGNAFIGVERDSSRAPQVLWPLSPTAVSVTRDPATGRPEYKLSTSTGMRPFTSDQILHIKGMTLPGALRGMSPVQYGAESIGRSLAAGQFASSYFSNGAIPGTVITADQKIDPEQAKILQKRFDSAHAGVGNAFKTVVLGNGASVQTLSLSPEAVQMIDTLRFGIADVARFYRINVSMLDPTVSSSWGTGVTEMNRWTASNTLSPWTVRLQRALQPLVTDSFMDANFYAAFNLKGFMRADPQAQAEYMKAKIECQAATPNEWRSMDDENPLPDGGNVLHSVQFQESVPGVGMEPVAPPVVA